MERLTKSFGSRMLEENAEVAELVDALDSGSSGVTPVGVRVPSSAPNRIVPKSLNSGLL